MNAAPKRKAPEPTKLGALQNRPADSSSVAHLIGRLALAGHVVHHGQTGDFTACKYGLSRYCPDFAALQKFAGIVGVRDE